MAKLRRKIASILVCSFAALCVKLFLILGHEGEKEPVTQLRKIYSNIHFGASPYGKSIVIEERGHKNYTLFDASWKASFQGSQFHPYYKVDCSALIRRDESVVARTNRRLETLRKGSGVPVPSDLDVIKFTTNCKEFKTQRVYPTFVRSKEERGYPIAYIIVTHKTAAQVERLLRAIYQPQNVYCIHPDAKSSPDFIAAMFSLANCFPNVFIPSKLERIQYRGITRLQADINCMKDLLSIPVQWKYVINLCGHDFPLKTNLEIVQQLKAFNGMNEIESVKPTSHRANRVKYRFWFRSGYKEPINTYISKPLPPHNIEIYFGNAYGAFVRSFVEFVVNAQEAKDLLWWMRDTWSPDENYWATFHQHPRATPVWRKGPTDRLLVRTLRWEYLKDYPPCEGKYVRLLCICGVGNLYHLSSFPHLFANKFHYNYDPVSLQCLEHLLDYRANFPQTVSDFVVDFPVRSGAGENLPDRKRQ